MVVACRFVPRLLVTKGLSYTVDSSSGEDEADGYSYDGDDKR